MSDKTTTVMSARNWDLISVPPPKENPTENIIIQEQSASVVVKEIKDCKYIYTVHRC